MLRLDPPDGRWHARCPSAVSPRKPALCQLSQPWCVTRAASPPHPSASPPRLRWADEKRKRAVCSAGSTKKTKAAARRATPRPRASSGTSCWPARPTLSGAVAPPRAPYGFVQQRLLDLKLLPPRVWQRAVRRRWAAHRACGGARGRRGRRCPRRRAGDCIFSAGDYGGIPAVITA